MIEKSLGTGLWPQVFEPFRAFGTRLTEWLAPASEAGAGDDAYTINVELPGVDEKDIELTVSDGMLTVKGEKREEHEEEGDTWYFSERQYGMFSRSFRLPEDANVDEIDATLKDGVLSITVPKLAQRNVGATKVKIRKS